MSGVVVVLICLLALPVLGQSEEIGRVIGRHGHTKESCGRMITKRAERVARMGYGMMQMPAACPVVRFPGKYYIATDEGRMVIYRRADDTRLLELIPPEPIPAGPTGKRNGIIGNQIWEDGELKGTLIVD